MKKQPATVKFMCGDWGMTDGDIIHDTIPISAFPFGLPRVGETVTTAKAHYFVKEVSHDLCSNCINIWFDEESSDIYDR